MDHAHPDRAAAGRGAHLPDELGGGTVHLSVVLNQGYRLLSATSDQSHLRGRDLKVNELRCRVEAAGEDRLQIRLTGQWETDHVYDGRRIRLRTAGDGVAVYGLREKSLESLLLVCHGAPLDDDGRPERPTGAVVEWRR